MAFYTYDIRKPDDVYEPKEHTIDELDAMGIPMHARDGCKNYYAEFKKCIAVQHQNNLRFKTWRKKGQDHCGYYFDHWSWCREVKAAEIGVSGRATSI